MIRGVDPYKGEEDSLSGRPAWLAGWLLLALSGWLVLAVATGTSSASNPSAPLGHAARVTADWPNPLAPALQSGGPDAQRPAPVTRPLADWPNPLLPTEF